MQSIRDYFRWLVAVWADFFAGPHPCNLGSPLPEPVVSRFGAAVVLKTHANHMAVLRADQARDLADKLAAAAEDDGNVPVPVEAATPWPRNDFALLLNPGTN